MVVTGASEGIGLAIAHRFANEGSTVVLIARRREPLEQAAAEIAARHRVTAIPLAMDMRSPDAGARLEAALRQRGLFVDVLVNNAGVGLAGPFIEHEMADLAGLVDLNVRSLTLLIRHFLPGMCARGRGGIINLASLGGYAPGPYQAAYYASKAYVIDLTKAIAHEVRGRGVRVCVVIPGPVRTRFHRKMGADNAFYRWIYPAPSAEFVARSTYRGYRWGLGVIYPGLLTATLALAMWIVPAIILAPILGVLLRPRGRGNARH